MINSQKRADYEKTDHCFESDTAEFVRNMKIGWNLGNTFDASSDRNKEVELAHESDWCGIATTREMVDACRRHRVKAAAGEKGITCC